MEQLTGEVTSIIFANETSGFAVIQLGDGARAIGPLATLATGQTVCLTGEWSDHSRYGPTFVASHYTHTEPRTHAGLIAFLSSPKFPGVGRVKAERLVSTFGLDLGKIIETEPERLTEVAGINAALAQSIARSWHQCGQFAQLMAALAAVGIGHGVAQAIDRHFGAAALQIVHAEPYELLGVHGVTWDRAEALATAAGIGPRDPRRLRAGVLAAHRQCCAAGGHIYLSELMLCAEAAKLLRSSEAEAAEAMRQVADAGMLVCDVEPLNGAQTPRWYAASTFEAERALSEEISRLATATSCLRRPDLSALAGSGLTAEQAAAVEAALSSPVTVLTGGPGTGKTRTIAEVVRACARTGHTLALCAPTGRAARRMEEATGHTAFTVHRLLGAQLDAGGRFTFFHDATTPLPYDMIVVDEWSMGDMRLALSLVSAVKGGAHVMFVGDADQLPSVGPGAVLRDLLACPSVAHTQLTKVHRQAATSRIITLAHEVKAGQVKTVRARDGDVFAVREEPSRIADRVAEIVAVRAPEFFGLPSSQVQVLAPMYRGPAGVNRLNERLKERLNPANGRRAVAGFHEGDRVVQTRNDAELDVANGDIGEVAVADATSKTLGVAFPHGLVTFSAAAAADLKPAWCLTVHKSQGGEWPVVVLVLDPAHRSMLWRELVYTGITRASQGLLLVGDPSLVEVAARRAGSGLRDRQTALTPRLMQRLNGDRYASCHL